jgi:menaquinone-dependent protoporphyrinogen oxidase
MARYAVVYATGSGQTRRVAERLCQGLSAEGHETVLLDHRDGRALAAVAGADAAVLAGSVHVGRVHRGLARFVTLHAELLAERPSALVIVCLAASKCDSSSHEVMEGYVSELLADTTWRPDVVEFVAGALRPSRLGPLHRRIVSFLSRQEGVDLPPDGIEFTDWEAVQRFGRSLSAWFPRVGVAKRAPGQISRL